MIIPRHFSKYLFKQTSSLKKEVIIQIKSYSLINSSSKSEEIYHSGLTYISVNLIPMEKKIFEKMYPCNKRYHEIEKRIQRLEKSIKFLVDFQRGVVITKDRYN